MSDKLSAALHGSGPCKKSCCWTPYGTCATQWSCEHHREDAHKQSRRDWAAEYQAEMRESEESSKRMERDAPWR